jgi:predicted PurR-regulated permease PerM
MRARLWRRGGRSEGPPSDAEYIEIDPRELAGVFAAPSWLRDLGLLSWLLVGIALAIAGAVWLLALTQVIVIPVLVAAIVAAVASPVVRWLNRHGVPRALGAALVLLVIVGVAAATVVLVLVGVASESSSISSSLSGAADTIEGWVQDAGVDPGEAEAAKADASASISTAFHALLDGLGGVLHELGSLAFFLAMVVLSLFFLLKDGPTIRRWGERHMGVPLPVAETITSRVLGSLRGYFLGVTIISAYNALLIGGGALLLGVPLAGSIALVTFVASYVPYLGAWGAGAFAVLIALSDGGAELALAMAVIALLANGILQQLVQPFAYGAALGIHPLAVLIVTIAGGAVFGTIGLILAAPITSAVVRISADLARAREEEQAMSEPSGEPGSPAPPPGPQPEPAS